MEREILLVESTRVTDYLCRSWNPVVFPTCCILLTFSCCEQWERVTGRMARRLLKSGYAESNAASARERGAHRLKVRIASPPSHSSDIPPGRTPSKEFALDSTSNWSDLGFVSPLPTFAPE